MFTKSESVRVRFLFYRLEVIKMSDVALKAWLNDFLMFSKKSKEFISKVNNISNLELLFEICTAANVGVPEVLLNNISNDMSVEEIKRIRDNFLREKYNVDVSRVLDTATNIGLRISKIENEFETAITNFEKVEKHLKNQLSIKDKELVDKENKLEKISKDYKEIEQRFERYKGYEEKKKDKEENQSLGNMEHKSVKKENTDKKDEKKYTSEDNYNARITFVKFLENYFCDKNIPEENKDFFLEFIEKEDTDFEMLHQAAKVKNLSVKQMKRLYEAMKRDIDLEK